MKHIIKSALVFSVFAGLAGCGLRGDLERPPPIFTEPPSEEAMLPVDTAVVFADAGIDQDRVYYNALGGEIPKPAPDADVFEESMGELGGR